MIRTILQVEDDSNDVFLLQHALKKVGVKSPFEVVSDGQEAINYLKGEGKFADRQRYPFPCLVLLDLKLPLVMGLDVLKWIRQRLKTPLVVIVLSASAEDSDISEAYQLGANAFLTKPSEASKLNDMVKAISDFWLTHSTLPRVSEFGGPSAAPRERSSTSIPRLVATSNGASRSIHPPPSETSP
jgi:CheY-like chemotaxis protein